MCSQIPHQDHRCRSKDQGEHHSKPAVRIHTNNSSHNGCTCINMLYKNIRRHLCHHITEQSSANTGDGSHKYQQESVVCKPLTDSSIYANHSKYPKSYIEGELTSIDELVKKNSLFADFQAVKSGQVYTTGSNFYQQSTGTCDFIEDLNQILTGEGDGTYRFLKKLQ